MAQVALSAVAPLLTELGQLEQAILARRQQKALRESTPKNQTPCQFFARRGWCRENERCGFLHQTNGPEGSYCPLDRLNQTSENSLRTRLEAYRRAGLAGVKAKGGKSGGDKVLPSSFSGTRVPFFFLVISRVACVYLVD